MYITRGSVLGDTASDKKGSLDDVMKLRMSVTFENPPFL